MSKSDINVTYLPITDSPTERVPAADWVLSHYDFARAKMLMHLLDKTYVNGPYVLSTLVALSMQSRPPEHFLFQDMSSVPGEVAVLWDRNSKTRAQKNFWAPATRDQAILQLRTFVANAAFAFSDVNERLPH